MAYSNVKRLLAVHPLPWRETRDRKGDICVKDANGTVVYYPVGKLSSAIADLIAAVVSYHAEEEPV